MDERIRELIDYINCLLYTSTCKQVIYQQEAETKEKEWGWKKDPYIYPRSFYSPVGYTPWDPWGRRL